VEGDAQYDGGIGVHAVARGDSAAALNVDGPAVFSRSGIATITFPAKTLKINGQRITSGTILLAVRQTSISGVWAVPTVGDPGSFTVTLNKAPGISSNPKTVRVGWFLVN
jgi:hypothetical protein